MPWKRTDVVDQRIEFVARAVGGGVDVSALCREYGISRTTGYRWINRHLETGSFTDLADRSRRPVNSPTRTDAGKQGQVMELRGRYGWGARKLQLLMKQEGVELTVATINRILKRNGLVKPEDSHARATKRFQRERPNELWQMDFKGWYQYGSKRCYPLSIIDDCSRYAVGLYALESTHADGVYDSLVRTLRGHGVPEGMLMDHGCPWWSTTSGHGLTWLSVEMMKQGIGLVYSGVGHPQTQGKVERFNGTLAAAVRHHGRPGELRGWQRLFDEFTRDYNEVRPHEALEMGVPAVRYNRSARQYQEQPAQWEYATGMTVRRLNTQGCLEYRRRRYFVCEALAGERVALEEAADKVLVSYRHMYIREIDPALGSTRALVLPKAQT